GRQRGGRAGAARTVRRDAPRGCAVAGASGDVDAVEPGVALIAASGGTGVAGYAVGTPLGSRRSTLGSPSAPSSVRLASEMPPQHQSTVRRLVPPLAVVLRATRLPPKAPQGEQYAPRAPRNHDQQVIARETAARHMTRIERVEHRGNEVTHRNARSGHVRA